MKSNGFVAQSSVGAEGLPSACPQLLRSGNRYIVERKGNQPNNLLALTSIMPRSRSSFHQLLLNPNASVYLRCACEHGDDVQSQGLKPWGSDRQLPSELIVSKTPRTTANACHVCDSKGLAVVNYATFKLLEDPVGLTGRYDKERVEASRPRPRNPRFPRFPRKK